MLCHCSVKWGRNENTWQRSSFSSCRHELTRLDAQARWYLARTPQHAGPRGGSLGRVSRWRRTSRRTHARIQITIAIFALHWSEHPINRACRTHSNQSQRLGAYPDLLNFCTSIHDSVSALCSASQPAVQLVDITVTRSGLKPFSSLRRTCFACTSKHHDLL